LPHEFTVDAEQQIKHFEKKEAMVRCLLTLFFHDISFIDFCNNVPTYHLGNIIQRSVNAFDKCLEKQPI